MFGIFATEESILRPVYKAKKRLEALAQRKVATADKHREFANFHADMVEVHNKSADSVLRKLEKISKFLD